MPHSAQRRRIVPALLAGLLALSPLVATAAHAQGQTGTIDAICRTAHGPMSLRLQFTRYPDGAVVVDDWGMFQDTIPIPQWGRTWWEGQMEVSGRRYALNGENAFIDAYPLNTSGIFTLELQSIGPNVFNVRDFTNHGGWSSCQIVARSPVYATN